MANLEDFLPEVSPEVIGCPEPSIIIAIRNSAIEFCEKSLYWAVNLDPIDIVANQHTYPLDSPETDSLVASVLVAMHDGQPLDPTSEDLLDLNWPTYQNKYKNVLRYGLGDPWRTVVVTKPALFYSPTPREIRMVGIPEASLVDGLTIKAGVKPNPTADDVGDIIYEDYHETIAWGALYRLMSQSNKAWTDKKMAVDYRGLFEEKVSEAKGRRLSGYNRQDQGVIRTKVYY